MVIGEVKAVNDMITNLIGSVKDKKVLAELTPIQAHLSSIMNDNITLASEKLELEKKIFSLEKKYAEEIAELQEKLSAKDLLSKYTFNEYLGCYVLNEDKDKLCPNCFKGGEGKFCPNCLFKGIESPLRIERTDDIRSKYSCQILDCKLYVVG